MEQSINALFGSKTRVKLLNLFFNKPDEKFYVREISRIIDEQVNSVRRELTNLEGVGVVKSSTEDRKIFYRANQRFKYYLPLRVIFAGVQFSEKEHDVKNATVSDNWQNKISNVKNSLDLLILFRVFTDDEKSDIDLLIVGNNFNGSLSKWAADLEKQEGRELNYMILSMEDFYYRYTTQDTFVKQLFNGKYNIVFDKENLLEKL